MITFSKFKKSLAKKELLNNLYYGKIEQSCYWAAEYICAGHFSELWDIILFFLGKHIHLGNPKLPIYIEMRFQTFKEIVRNGYIDNVIALRNNEKIRKLFAELISVLCLSKKKNSYDTIKVEDADFDIINITNHLHATNISYAQKCFRKGDPSELFIALNEFVFNISTKNTMRAAYWVEWIMEFEKKCISKKKKCEGERREKAPVESKMQKDVIWIIWETLINEASNRDKLISRNMNSLLKLFCIQYTSATKRRRRFLIYFAISLITESWDLSTSIFTDKMTVEKVVLNINVIYKQIKKNEEKTKTGYLFNNSFTNIEAEKSMQKIEQMKQINTVIPRN